MARLRESAAALAALLVALVVGLAGPATAATSAPPPLPADTGVNGHWWFVSWRIQQVWALGALGQGVTVGIIDSGVQASFPELRGATILPGTDFAGGDGRVDAEGLPNGNTRGHGTQMALLIAGQGGPMHLVGVAPQARILPVVDAAGSVGRAIHWAVDHGAKVVNLSLAAAGACNGDNDEASGVRYALDHGAVVVAASGNEGLHDAELSPADCPGVLTVGAFDYRLQVPSWSNRASYVSAAAPGVHLVSTNALRQNGYTDGTSDSAALASAAVALVWSKYPNLTNRQVVARLLATAKDLDAPGKDDATGYGGLRPYQAITTDVPADAPNPVFDKAYAAASPSAASAVPGRSSSPSPGGGSGGLPKIVAAVVSVAILLGVVAAFVVGALSWRRRARRRALEHPGIRPPGAPWGPAPPAPPGPPPSPTWSDPRDPYRQR